MAGLTADAFVSRAREAYHRAPAPVRNLISPIFWGVKRAVMGVFGMFRTHMWIIEGACGCEKLSIACALSEKSKNYLADLVFGRQYRETYIGRMWLWNAPRRARKASCGCSMLLVGTHKRLGWLLGRNRGFPIPCWVGGEIESSEYLNKSSTKTDAKLIMKHSLACEVTRARDLFEAFYHQMHLPHIYAVYKDRAFPVGHEEMENKINRCELVLASKDGGPIGGALVRYGKGAPRIWAYGVKDGNREHLISGAITASTYFAVKHLVRKGFKRVHFGGSRPFLKDSVLRFKVIRGLQLTDSTKYVFLLLPLSRSEGLKKFLIENPFIYQVGGRLAAAIFADSSNIKSEEDYRRIYKESFITGLQSINVHVFGQTGVCPSVPAELTGRLSVQSAESLFKA